MRDNYVNEKGHRFGLCCSGHALKDFWNVINNVTAFSMTSLNLEVRNSSSERLVTDEGSRELVIRWGTYSVSSTLPMGDVTMWATRQQMRISIYFFDLHKNVNQELYLERGELEYLLRYALFRKKTIFKDPITIQCEMNIKSLYFLFRFHFRTDAFPLLSRNILTQ